MLRRLLPHPLLTLALTLLWLLLVNGYSLGSLIFGFLLGLAIPLLTAAWWPDRPRIKNVWAAVEFMLIVLLDIVRSNITVARIVLFKPNSALRPAWICIPLDVRSPEAITILAGTITMTPGTVTSDMSQDGRMLLVHCLDAPDPDAVRDAIKSRYESRLMRIFG